jgi:hypothetical protein
MKGKKWTAEQEEILIQYYQRKEVSELAALIGKSEQAIMNRASELGIKRRLPMEKDNRKQDRDAKQILLIDVESEMEKCENILLRLCKPGNAGMWTTVVSQYHALCIKWHQMRGEQPAVTHGKPDYII